MGELWGVLAARSPTLIALAIALGFLRWLIPFIFVRLDVARGHLGQRLKHLEVELDAYREVAMLMIGVVAKIDPGNRALIAAAEILRTTSPRSRLSIDELVAKLSAIPGTDEKGGEHGLAT